MASIFEVQFCPRVSKVHHEELDTKMYPMRLPGWLRAGRKSGTNHQRIGRRKVCARSFMAIVLMWIVYFCVFSNTGGTFFSISEEIHDRRELHPCYPLSAHTKELVDAIKASARLAAGGEEPADLTEKERREWDLANPCQSRLGLKSVFARRKYAADVAENLEWEKVLEEYAKLHRTCRRRVGNLKEYFLTRNSSIAGCKFAIADYSEGGGLGNKIIAVTNTVLYSILTQRIVLVPSATLVPALMCEPFPGSSWVLDADDSFPAPPWSPAHRGSWTYYDEVYRELDDAKTSKDSAGTPRSTVFSSGMSYYQYQPDSRFYCDAEQSSLAGVTWLYFTGCLYIIPRFFTVPSLRPTLEALFPDRLVLTHLVRSIMLPEDLVWGRIMESFETNLETADRRVGVQIRYRRNLEEYEQMNDIINDRLMKCALDNGILPAAVDLNATNGEPSRHRPIVKLFIASLFTGFSDLVSETYLSRPKSTAEVVSLVQLSHESKQAYGLEVDRQSLLEIMMLSFSDELFVTPLSTFGGLAQAYGVLVPWIIDFRYGNQFGPCGRAQTVDLCYQEAHFSYSCPHDPDVNGRVIAEVVPYIRNCLAVDSQPNIAPGFQLITSQCPELGTAAARRVGSSRFRTSFLLGNRR